MRLKNTDIKGKSVLDCENSWYKSSKRQKNSWYVWAPVIKPSTWNEVSEEGKSEI
jgi:hypothetical protein